MQKVPKEKCVS